MVVNADIKNVIKKEDKLIVKYHSNIHLIYFILPSKHVLPYH